jgi:hypothetical protein
VPLDKTLTVKQRRIDVYLPTLEAKARWNAEAAKRNQSISQLVFELVELALQPPEEAVGPTEDFAAKAAKLAQEMEALKRRNEELEALYERAAQDLVEYRASEFLGGNPIKRLDPRLLKFLSEAKTRTGEPRPVDHPELVQALRIKKGSEAELKSLAAQLELLELHEVIRKGSKGWTWND